MHYILLIISAALVNNFVLSRFLGICPFIGVSKSTDTAIGMSMAVVFVIALASLVGLYMTLQAYVWPFALMVVH